MIKFHPTSQQISDFVQGTLSPPLALMVAAHCDMCPKCRALVEIETESLAAEMLTDVGDEFDSNIAFGDMLSSITDSNEKDTATSSVNIPLSEIYFDNGTSTQAEEKSETVIELDGRKFAVPSTLQRYIQKTGNWSSLVGKLWQAPVELGNQGVANFIYMAQGGSVPEHTHRGTEYTLVIDGEFSDGLNHYDTGDFIYMDGEKTHTPRADTKEGCLVFSIVDQPLHFTSGLARLLNPFSHLFFR